MYCEDYSQRWSFGDAAFDVFDPSRVLMGSVDYLISQAARHASGKVTDLN